MFDEGGRAGKQAGNYPHRKVVTCLVKLGNLVSRKEGKQADRQAAMACVPVHLWSKTVSSK